MREYLNEEHRLMFDRFYRNAVTGGCDLRQAESIAKERVLKVVMKASAAIHKLRVEMGENILRDNPRGRTRVRRRA